MRQNGAMFICNRCGKAFEEWSPEREHKLKAKLCPECDKALDGMARNLRGKLVAYGLLSHTQPQSK